MSLTGQQLLTGVSSFIGDNFSSSTTSAGSVTTLVDTALRKYGGEDWLRGWYLRITEAAHGSLYDVRRITAFAAASGTCTVVPAFTATIGAGVDYELHRYDPTGKFSALDEARVRAYPDVCEIVFDETVTGDGHSASFAIPSTIRDGPFFVMEEIPAVSEVEWNLDGDPTGDDTTKWSGSSATLSTVSRTNIDPLIPKYDNTAISITVASATAATVTQVVANMSNMTAAKAAGRTITAARWVYSRVASKIRLQLIDDSTTTSGSYHGGKGWELLTVTKDSISTNATTFSLRLDFASVTGGHLAYLGRGWLYYGDVDRILDLYDYTMAKIIRRDDTTKRVYLERPIQRGRQVRMVGRDTLTALGTVAATQVTNTMEIDEQSAQYLYAISAQIIFEREGLQANDPDVAQRIGAVMGRAHEYATKFPYTLPVDRKLRGMWS